VTLKIISSADVGFLTLAKRRFTIDINQEKICVEGHTHKNVALKYLMKRRRSLLMTKDPNKVERLYCNLPQTVKVMGKHVTRSYAINWEKKGTTDFQGSRFVFALQENHNI
jgi:predicted NAD-dependent protein-ADP-ribosyltransferase YbiA (DUF1768 family)